MITRALLLIPLMMLVACSSDTPANTANTSNRLSRPQDDASAHQLLESASKYSKVSNNREGATNYHDTYYKSEANIIHIPNSKQIKINVDDLLIIINLINGDGSYLDFKKGNDYLNKFAEIGFNYTYGIDFETALQGIKVFKNKSLEEGLLVLPATTEEFPAYSILPFNATGIKQSYSISVQSFDCANFDTIILGAATLNANAAQSISISQKGKPCKAEIYESNSIENLKLKLSY